MNATRTTSETGTSELQGRNAAPAGKVENRPAPPAEGRTPRPSGTTVFISGSESAAGPRSSRRRIGMTLVTALSGLALSYAGYHWWILNRTWVGTDNAYVAAHVHTVSSRVAGTVQEVDVDENQAVQAGSVLARLDSRDFEIRREQALAQLAQARAQKQQAEAGLAEARAQAAREQARARKALLDLERAQALLAGASGTISQQEYDQAKADADAAQAAFEAANSAVGSAEALVAAAEANIRTAQASLDDAQLQISYTEIRAPAAGRIGKKNLEQGNRVQPGQALLALVQPEVWVTANFKETQLARMKPGQAVEIRLDAFPGHRFNGRVESLSPASGAQFALLPPDNATGNFTRIVQRVPVKIVFDEAGLGEFRGRIVPGMSAVVEVKVRES